MVKNCNFEIILSRAIQRVVHNPRMFSNPSSILPRQVSGKKSWGHPSFFRANPYFQIDIAPKKYEKKTYISSIKTMTFFKFMSDTASPSEISASEYSLSLQNHKKIESFFCQLSCPCDQKSIRQLKQNACDHKISSKFKK